jgi:hypothetical protein
VDGVLDRLTKSTHLQAIHFTTGISKKTLEKMAKLDGLRGVYLIGCDEDWSVLTKIPSLQSVRLLSSLAGLLDCSPFLQAWPSLNNHHVLTQQYQRSEHEVVKIFG